MCEYSRNNTHFPPCDKFTKIFMLFTTLLTITWSPVATSMLVSFCVYAACYCQIQVAAVDMGSLRSQTISCSNVEVPQSDISYLWSNAMVPCKGQNLQTSDEQYRALFVTGSRPSSLKGSCCRRVAHLQVRLLVSFMLKLQFYLGGGCTMVPFNWIKYVWKLRPQLLFE